MQYKGLRNRISEFDSQYGPTSRMVQAIPPQ